MEDLVNAGEIGQDQIGVITPYALKLGLFEIYFRALTDLEVKTVDGYQGREKEIIIFSCVRSNPEEMLGSCPIQGD